MQEVYDFLKNAVSITWPRWRRSAESQPFGTVDIFEGKLYIQTGKSKEVSKQLRQIQRRRYALCRRSGSGCRVNSSGMTGSRRKALLDNYPELKNMYSPEDDNTEVLYFEDATAVSIHFR